MPRIRAARAARAHAALGVIEQGGHVAEHALPQWVALPSRERSRQRLDKLKGAARKLDGASGVERCGTVAAHLRKAQCRRDALYKRAVPTTLRQQASHDAEHTHHERHRACRQEEMLATASVVGAPAAAAVTTCLHVSLYEKEPDGQ